MEAPFKRGDIVVHKTYGLAVVHSLHNSGNLEVNWLLVNPHRSQHRLIFRDEHPNFDMRTAASNFTKIGEVPDG